MRLYNWNHANKFATILVYQDDIFAENNAKESRDICMKKYV